MKILIVIAMIFLTNFAHADFGHGPDGHFTHPETGATATPKEKISGHCTVVAGNGNLIAQPCGSLVLTLSNKKSGILYSRTSDSGTFEFNVPGGQEYKLGVNSRMYEVISPTDDVARGEDLEVQLKQK